jgi:hypothetical protein
MAKQRGIGAWNWLPLGRLPGWAFVPITMALVSVDWLTGPYYQFPSVYIVVVVLAAWFNGLTTGLLLALVLPFSRVALMEAYWDRPWDPEAYLATAATRAIAWSLLAVITARLAEHERALSKEVDALITLLPVCADCHMIRGAGEQWEKLDTYVAQHAEQFSPGLCPNCLRARLPEHIAPE